jgi:hypothetical protein
MNQTAISELIRVLSYFIVVKIVPFIWIEVLVSLDVDMFIFCCRVRVVGFNATFNNISVVLVKKTELP